MRITNGRGVDLILDAVGKPTFEKGLACLAPFGHLILYGSAGGAPEPIDLRRHLFAKSQKVSGFVVPMVYGMSEIHRRGLDAVFQLAREAALRFRSARIRARRGCGGGALPAIAPLHRQAPADSLDAQHQL